MYGNCSSKQVCTYVCVKYVHFDCYIDVQLFPAINGLPLLHWNHGTDEKGMILKLWNRKAVWLELWRYKLLHTIVRGLHNNYVAAL